MYKKASSDRESHEGLTYAEMDLMKDSQRPPLPVAPMYRPTEYARVPVASVV